MIDPHASTHPVTLAFADPELEAGFRRGMGARQKVLGRVALTVGAVFVSLFGLLDWLLAGEALRFCLQVRFGFMLPAVLLGLGVLALPKGERHGTAAQLLPTVCAGLGVVAMTTRLPSPAAEQYYAGVIVVLVFGHAITYTRFIHVTAATSLIIVAYAATAATGELGSSLVSNLFFLVAAQLALMAGSYLHEQQRRRIFVQTRRLESLSSELEDQALLDPLTGLGNRRALDRDLAQQRAEAGRYAVPATLLLADLDHFKRINDQLGHPRGDAFLVAFARRIQGLLRDVDRAYRFGGDEFLVLLPHTAVEDAGTVAQRLILAVQDVALELDLAHLDVSCSVGLARVTGGSETESLSAVDAAMYAAKAERGTFRIAEEPDAVEPPHEVEAPPSP